MKNIHVLPTDKPSRLWTNNLRRRLELDEFPSQHPTNIAKHIYITSDEEIDQQTLPCWCINTIKNTWKDDLIYYQGSMPQYHYKGLKRIILTDDQDLIKDGVQAIDDDFLEWFVKNPNCEEVKVEEIDSKIPRKEVDGYFSNETLLGYKIIIPKEEPKEFTTEMLVDLKQGLDNAMQKSNPLFPNYKHLNKQETLEEAAKRLYPIIEEAKKLWQESHPNPIEMALFGAKWQSERSYSEEEVLELYCSFDAIEVKQMYDQLVSLFHRSQMNGLVDIDSEDRWQLKKLLKLPDNYR